MLHVLTGSLCRNFNEVSLQFSGFLCIFLAYQASAHSNSDLFSILKNGNLLTQLILMFLFSIPLTLNQAQHNTMYTWNIVFVQ